MSTFANSIDASTAGLQALSSAGAFNGRTVTGTANQIAVANGDGSSGNPTLSLTSSIYVSGISFDSGSNTLAAYAAGTYSPTVTGSSSNPTVSYSSQVGNYEKIGTKVIVNGYIALSAYSGGTGNIQLSALPFTSLNSANAVSEGSVTLGSVTFGSSVLYYDVEVSVNSTLMILPGIRTGTTTLSLAVAGAGASSIFIYNAAFNI